MPMRFPKGSIQLNPSRDLPLLRQILHSEFVTQSQLFEFSQLNHYERSRNSFHWRMRRLVDRGLVLRERLWLAAEMLCIPSQAMQLRCCKAWASTALLAVAEPTQRKRTELRCMRSR